MEKLSSEAANIGKESMDAWMKSGSVFMKGYEDMLKTCMGIAQKSVEKNGEAFKTLLACKTVNEYAEVQNRLAQQGFDDFMTGATKISELGIKLASEGFAPINDQVSKAVKKASDAVAA
jgi:phasin family protein